MGTGWRISIKDKGVGISKENLERIFDPYFTTKEMGAKKGLGLGLAISHSVVSNHNGYITAESKPNQGSTFHIYLPAIRANTLADTAISKFPGKVKGKPRILVMDDDEIVRDISSKMLNRIGYEISLARNGEEAVQIYSEKSFSGKNRLMPFFLDLTVRGGMGGREAVRRILEIDPNARAIVSSGYSEDPEIYDFASYGFKAAAIKPYSISELREILDGVFIQ